MRPDFFWSACGAYPGKKLFFWGTAIAADAFEAREVLGAMFRECFPFEPPDFEPVHGMVHFYGNDRPLSRPLTPETPGPLPISAEAVDA